MEEIDRKVDAFHRNVRRLPRIIRIFLGLFLITGGIFGFLPILGFWMVPVGLAVLAIDIPIAHRAWERLRAFMRKRLGREEGDAKCSNMQERDDGENEP